MSDTQTAAPEPDDDKSKQFAHDFADFMLAHPKEVDSILAAAEATPLGPEILKETVVMFMDVEFRRGHTGAEAGARFLRLLGEAQEAAEQMKLMRMKPVSVV